MVQLENHENNTVHINENYRSKRLNFSSRLANETGKKLKKRENEEMSTNLITARSFWIEEQHKRVFVGRKKERMIER